MGWKLVGKALENDGKLKFKRGGGRRRSKMQFSQVLAQSVKSPFFV